MELGDHYQEIQDLDTEVLAISADDLAGAEKIIARVDGIPFPILYDPETGVIHDYGADKKVGRLAIPITFVIDKDGIIRWKYVGTVLDRPSVATVVDQLRILDG